jgi:hypothetical protein
MRNRIGSYLREAPRPWTDDANAARITRAVCEAEYIADERSHSWRAGFALGMLVGAVAVAVVVQVVAR